MRQFFAFRMQERKNESHTLLHSRRLFQQFIVDAYRTMESNRLRYLKLDQSTLRSNSYDSLKESESAGKEDMHDQGTSFVLPASFTGGPRYMKNNYLDAMAICKHFGFPDFFITSTCNPKWPEITRYLKSRNLKTEDKSDIICRMCRMKLDSDGWFNQKKNILGKTVSVDNVYVEFQKRVLPHAHIILFMDPKFKLPTTDDIDKIISAEIPDKNEEPELYDIIKDMMIHGPCGAANMNYLCMENGKCSKLYTKSFADKTIINREGFSVYRRRELSDRYVEKNGVKCDNRSVIPYNKKLSLRYRAHINVECWNQAGSINYLFKYITKGSDRVTVVVEPPDHMVSNVEVLNPQRINSKISFIAGIFLNLNGLNMFLCEPSWIIFKFSIHYRSTEVEKLTFHLPGKKHVIFKGKDKMQAVISRKLIENTMFLPWFELNKVDSFARTKTYAQIPNFYTHDKRQKKFKRRKRGFSIGRINCAPSKQEDSYYLRVLLNIVKDPTNYDDLKIEACFARGLLDDDKEYIDDIIRRSYDGSANEMRQVFVTMIMNDSLSMPKKVWELTWECLAEDIEHNKRKFFNRPGLLLSDKDKKKYTLLEIEKLLRRNGTTLGRFTYMPKLPVTSIHDSNVLIQDKRSYDHGTLLETLERDVSKMTDEQKKIYDEIITAVNEGKGGMFFVYGFDEAPMMSKHCFEALDRSLSDIIGKQSNNPFGGKVIVFGGDFRKVLPVILGAGRAEIVLASMNSSYLWEHCKVLKLTKIMRIFSGGLSVEESKDLKEFSEWILKVGDGKLAEPNDGPAEIEIPSEFLISDSNDRIEAISRVVYGDCSSLQENKEAKFFQERAILCPTNEDVNVINDYMLDKLHVLNPTDKKSVLDKGLGQDFLNSIKVSGLPNHSLRLKVGCPVMVLRNINPAEGLMNGTRLQITKLMDFMVQARIITGGKVGKIVDIPRLLITASDTRLPFKMRRRQLPLAVVFAITINKSQGQSLSEVGIFLPRPMFFHGHLYVAISRVTSKKGLKILIVDKDGKPQKKIVNVVFKEVFNNL
ncbi:hypothetical protein N665_1161s0005 [Sinapis alba]|nr:hypothetical protein N665_1161s0005 [Sinapis alba]